MASAAMRWAERIQKARSARGRGKLRFVTLRLTEAERDELVDILMHRISAEETLEALSKIRREIAVRP